MSGIFTADRVRDTSTSTGTGPFTVSGTAPTGFNTFADAPGIVVGSNLYATIAHQTLDEWIVAEVEYTAANQLTVVQVLDGSSGPGVAVSFSAGTKDVFLTLPASRSPIKRFGELRSYSALPGTTIYVATTGSDSNDGFSSGAPVLTVTKAFEIATGIAIDSPNAPYINIEIADGTYNEAGAIILGREGGANSRINVYSASGIRANCIINLGSQAIRSSHPYLLFYGITFQTSGAALVTTDYLSYSYYESCTFKVTGNPAYVMRVYDRSSVDVWDSEFDGDCQRLIWVGSSAVATFRGSLTITGSPSFSQQAIYLTEDSVFNFFCTSVTGSATGSRWSVDATSNLAPRTLGLDDIPGSVNGNVFPMARKFGALTAITESGGDYSGSYLSIYVDGTNGNDANDGLTWATAVATIPKAFEIFNGLFNDTGQGVDMYIEVAAGTYTVNEMLYIPPDFGWTEYASLYCYPGVTINFNAGGFGFRNFAHRYFDIFRATLNFNHAGTYWFTADAGARLSVTNCTINFAASQTTWPIAYITGAGSRIDFHNCTINGGGFNQNALVWAEDGGRAYFTGTLNVSNLAWTRGAIVAYNGSYVSMGATLTDTSTGRMWELDDSSTIENASATTCPGTILGNAGPLANKFGRLVAVSALAPSMPSYVSIYVNAATGSDSNDGLTAGTPFLTLDKAFEYANTIVNDFPVGATDLYIDVAAGTYGLSTGVDAPMGGWTYFSLTCAVGTTINMDLSTFDVLQSRRCIYAEIYNCTINLNAAFSYEPIRAVTPEGALYLYDVTINLTVANPGRYIFSASQGARLQLYNVTINGGGYTWGGIGWAYAQGYIDTGGTLNVSNAVWDTAAFRATAGSVVELNATLTDTSTGPMWSVETGSIIKNANATYCPGSIPGNVFPVANKLGGLIAASAVAVAGVVTLHVNASTGSDSNSGFSSSAPLATIGKAADIASTIFYDLADGGYINIEVAPGTYNETDIRLQNQSPDSSIYMYSSTFNKADVIVNLASGSNVPIYVGEAKQFTFIYNMTFVSASSLYFVNCYHASVYFYDCEFQWSVNKDSIFTGTSSPYIGINACTFTKTGGTTQRWIEGFDCVYRLFGTTTFTNAIAFGTAAVDLPYKSVYFDTTTLAGAATTGPKWSFGSTSDYVGSGGRTIVNLPGSTNGNTYKREILSANRTYYVRTDGSNSNTGTANTAGGAWATLQYAWDWIAANIDVGAYTVTIQVGAGTYAGLSAVSKQTGTVSIVGDTTTPANVVVSASICFYFGYQNYPVQLSGFQCNITGAGLGVFASRTTLDVTGAMNFVGSNAGARPFKFQYHATCTVQYVPLRFDGTFSCGFELNYESYVDFSSSALTLVAGTSFATAFAKVTMNSVAEVYLPSISGTATGKRYTVTTNSVIEPFGGGASYFPGDTAGTASEGGRYIGVTKTREVLTANRTYYIRTDGNNANTGLENTAGGAFATLQYAWDWVAANIDIGAYVVTFKVANGTYSGGPIVLNTPMTGRTAIEGDLTTPGNVVFNCTSGSVCWQISRQNYEISYGGFELKASHGGCYVLLNAISCFNLVAYGNMKFNNVSGPSWMGSFSASDGKYEIIGVTCEYVGNFGSAFAINGRSYGDIEPYLTLNSNAFSGAFITSYSAEIFWYNYGTTGTATGKKYALYNQAFFDPWNGDLTLVPGDLPGSVASGALVTGTSSQREVITANRTYYVSTTGSNSNDGRTSGQAWLTLQYAWDWIAANLDIGAYVVTIQLADGTYTGAFNGTAPQTGIVQILGNTTTPANVKFSTTYRPFSLTNQPHEVRIGGFETEITSGGGDLLTLDNCRYVFLNHGIEFDPGGSTSVRCIRAFSSKVYLEYNKVFKIYADPQAFVRASLQSNVVLAAPDITLDGTPNFSGAFIVVDSNSYVEAELDTVTGTATGVRYDVKENGVLTTFGGGATYLPGDTAGTTATGGQYL